MWQGRSPRILLNWVVQIYWRVYEIGKRKRNLATNKVEEMKTTTIEKFRGSSRTKRKTLKGGRTNIFDAAPFNAEEYQWSDAAFSLDTKVVAVLLPIRLPSLMTSRVRNPINSATNIISQLGWQWRPSAVTKSRHLARYYISSCTESR